MRKVFDYDTVRQLIMKGGFGTYRLFLDNVIVGGSHLAVADTETGDYKMKPEDLLIDLQGNIDLMGDGHYKIVLKRSNRSQAGTEVTYLFDVRDEKEEAPIRTEVMAGMSLPADKLEELVTARVTRLMELKQAEYERQREVDLLRAEIAELKKKKPPVRRKKNDLAGLLNLGLVGGSALVAKYWPESTPLVEKALDAIKGLSDTDDEDEDEEDATTGFTRPE